MKQKYNPYSNMPCAAMLKIFYSYNFKNSVCNYGN